MVVDDEEFGVLVGQPTENLCGISLDVDGGGLLSQLDDVHTGRKNSIKESLEVLSPISDPRAEVQTRLGETRAPLVSRHPPATARTISSRSPDFNRTLG